MGVRTWLGELLLQIGVEPPFPGDGRVGRLRVQGLVRQRRRRHAHSLAAELAGSVDGTANETKQIGSASG